MTHLFHLLCWLVVTPLSLSAVEPPTTRDINQKMISPLDGTAHKACVLIFITTDCPIANSYAPEIQRIMQEYSKKSVKFTLVHVDPDLAEADAAKHAREYQLDGSGAIIIDRTHDFVKIAKATVTPEAAVFTPDLSLVYLGRINDQFAGYGDRRVQAASHDLRNALDAVLAGKPVPAPRAEAIGCYIPDLD
jgi:hypothetical protein